MEGETVVFTVTKTGATVASFSVNYATAAGTAGGSDFVGKSGTLTFTSTQTSRTISVTASSDTTVEGNETFYVNLSSPSGGATLTDSQGRGIIINNSDSCSLCSSQQLEAEVSSESDTAADPAESGP